MLETINADMSKGENVYISGFGSFEVKERAEKVKRDLTTNETINIPASKVPSLKPAQALEDALN